METKEAIKALRLVFPGATVTAQSTGAVVVETRRPWNTLILEPREVEVRSIGGKRRAPGWVAHLADGAELYEGPHFWSALEVMAAAHAGRVVQHAKDCVDPCQVADGRPDWAL